jgi:RND family efflux transporter MFP subunit
VNLVARVQGFLEEIKFQDGSFVNKGTVLFVIEQDTYQQKVLLYEAQLQQAQAEYDRQLSMIKQNATSQANVEKWLSERDQAKANVELAKIELGYTTVLAPFDGRIGEHLVDVGNVVGTNAAEPTKLASFEQLVPIYINFSVSSRDALRIREIARKRGLGVKPGVGQIPVYAGLENEAGYPHQGVLDFVNNSVDTSTGTIQLRAIFQNEDRDLFPGLFARVRIALGEPEPTLVVPSEAVANDQSGDYVFVVNPQKVVERRDVSLGPREGEMRAVTQGLSKEDRVIVRGLASVRRGARVNVQEAPNPPGTEPTPSNSPTPPGAATPASKATPSGTPTSSAEEG